MKTFFAWLQLVRFPNVFTILADILTVGFWTCVLRGFTPQLTLAFAGAGIGSVCLYWAGMVLNDVCDAEEDAVLRSSRPIPSGRIALETARKAGWGLWGTGLALCVLAGFAAKTAEVTAGIAVLLALCVWAYDARLKNSPMGPFLMGFCRGLNLLLFLSFWPLAELTRWPLWGFPSPLLLYPLALTIFITGVTFYARCETEDAPEVGIRRPGPALMLLAAAFLAGGFAMLINFPAQLAAWRPGSVVPLFLAQTWRWPLLMLFLMVWLSLRAVSAYFQGPLRVRMVVKQALFSVFLLDAALTLVVCGLPYAFVILGLFLIASFIGKWVYST